MSKELLTEIDVTGLNRFNSQLLGALIGTGQGGDVQRFVRTEAGQLADSIQKTLGANDAKTNRRITSDVKRHLTSKPNTVSLNQESEKYADFTWLYASPRFVLGVNDEDNMDKASATDALSILRGAQKRNDDRGDTYVDMGYRKGAAGKQRFMRLNRVRISKSAMASILHDLKEKVGEMRASFAFTASELICKNYPEKISKHFAGWARGKVIFDDTKCDGVNPVITFGSRAKGVQSNPMITDKIARAVESRKHILASKMKKIIQGYTYDWNTGAVFRQQVPQGGIPD